MKRSLFGRRCGLRRAGILVHDREGRAVRWRTGVVCLAPGTGKRLPAPPRAPISASASEC